MLLRMRESGRYVGKVRTDGVLPVEEMFVKEEREKLMVDFPEFEEGTSVAGCEPLMRRMQGAVREMFSNVELRMDVKDSLHAIVSNEMPVEQAKEERERADEEKAPEMTRRKG